MKKFCFVLLLFLVFPVIAAAGEVVFIPGWYSQWINYSGHTEVLQQLFPGDTVKVRKWHSNRLWKNARESAGKVVTEITGEIAASSVPQEITLIGHSLGGRIVLDCASFLADKKISVRQIILLGTAGEMTAEDIDACRKVSRLPVINIFCPDDNMLKLYIRQEKSMPLGFAGLPVPQVHFKQYRLPVESEDIKLWDVNVIPGEAAEPFRETAAHLAKKYVAMLQKVICGSVTEECYINFAELEKLAAVNAVVPDKWPGFKEIETFDNWVLARRKYRLRYRITTPGGKHFFFQDAASAEKNFAAIKKQLSGN